MYTDLLRTAQPKPSSATTTGHQEVALPLKNPRENHQLINFWTLADWKSYKNNVKINLQSEVGSTGEQAKLEYIESEDGIPVSPDRVKAMRSCCRELFLSIQLVWEKAGRSIPVKWKNMNYDDKDFFRRKLKAQFPELGFCENDWKCEELATNTYSGWHRTYGKAGDQVKPEPNGKQQSKRTASSSKSLTPAPDHGPGRSHPLPSLTPATEDVLRLPMETTPTIPTSSSTCHPGEPHPVPLRAPNSIASPVTSLHDFRLPSDPAPTQEGSHGTLKPPSNSNPIPSLAPLPSPLPRPDSPMLTDAAIPPVMDHLDSTLTISVNAPSNTNPSLDVNQSTNTIPLTEMRIPEVATPTTPTASLQQGTSPGSSIQVCPIHKLFFRSMLTAYRSF
jgi:hypothetical protein